MTEHTPLIELEHVSFSYGEREVLTDVNLTIHQGDYLAILGPNGAGKTTLLKLIFGLLTPQKGTIRLFGTPSATFKDRSRIGYVPQKTAIAERNFPATVFDVVLMGRTAKRGLFHPIRQTDKDAALLALRRVGLLELADRMISDLSGGQTQRVFIARALATEPAVLILDEPTAGVDPHAQEDLYGLLRSLNTESGITIMIVSHDIETITKETSQIAYVDRSLTYHESSLSFIESDFSRVVAHGHDH